MLHALIRNKLKDSINFSDLQAFKASEDSLTSSIFGTMQYLHDELVWDLIRRSCSSKVGLTEKSGSLNKIEFWPKWNSKDTKNSNYVEPDIFIQFDNFHLIIEAKKNDNHKQNAQHLDQWKNEIKSYLNEQIEYDSGELKNLHFIAFGGNENLINTFVESEGNNYMVHKASWQTLLNESVKLRLSLESNTNSTTGHKQLIRILKDVENAFNTHGFFCIDWFESDKILRNIFIENSTIYILNKWTTNQKQFFSKIFDLKFDISLPAQSINTLSRWML